MNVKQLYAKRKALVGKMGDFLANDQAEEALRIEGQITALDEQIESAIEDEDSLRNAPAINVVTPAKPSFIEQVLGMRDQFTGIGDGFRQAGRLEDAVSGLGTPQIYRRDLRGPVAPPTGFLGTILHGTTDGDEHFFKTPVLTNNAAGWTTGNKPESALEWTEGTALLETVAHYIPIKKQTANRYSQLETIVKGSLMMGLDLKCDEYALRGSNSSGIVGVCNTPGILNHSKVAAKNLKDTFATMRRKARVASGIAPDYICISPYALEELSQTKDNEGRYLFPEISNGGTIAGMTVVEDVNMTYTSGSGDDAVTKETALVYWSGAASWDVADPEEVIIGLVNSQLIQNEYTVLAELTAALRVDTPAAICYCPDLGLDAE